MEVSSIHKLVKQENLIYGSFAVAVQTTHMFFGTPCTDQNLELSIRGKELDIVQKTKYLGVQIDCSLDWKEQIKAVSAKVSRAIGFLKHAKKFLPRVTLENLYTGIVEPHFRYCCSVWGCCGSREINQPVAEIEGGGRGGGCPPKATKNCINLLGVDPRLAHLSGHCWALPPHRKILATPLQPATKASKPSCQDRYQ